MDLRFTCWLINLIFIAISGRVTSDLTIEPEKVDGIENSNATFKCLSNVLNSRIRWKWNKKDAACSYGTLCEFISASTNDRMKCICDSLNNTVLWLHIRNISTEDHNTSFTCQIIHGNGINSTNATVYVKVPVKVLDIMPLQKKIEISENSNYQFNCSSSNCRPTPDITWIVKNENKILSFKGIQTNITDLSGFTSSFSTLNYHAIRAVNGWEIYCVVKRRTDVQHEEIRSRHITLNITYSPESKLKINGFATKRLYRVIADHTGILICTIVGGNPRPLLKWKRCFEKEQYSIVSAPTTKESAVTLKWNAEPDTDRICTCQSMQKERNDSLSIYIEVLYPPTIPTLTFNNSVNVSGYIYVLLGEQLLLDCDSNSKPISNYQWIYNRQMLANTTLQIRNTEKIHKGHYTCIATNIMNATETVQNGYINTTIELQVLYPPSIPQLEDITLVEGATINIPCPINHGNPSETVFRWTSERNKTWSSQNLSISNISRNDEMNYNCTVYNIMTPTGKSPVKGTDSETFHLSVEYNATIKDFFVNGYQSGRNVYVNENETVTFICAVDSRPISNTSLQYRTAKTLVWNNSNILNYTLGFLHCIDAGAYFCYGKNKHNIGFVSKKELNLFVRCFPRPNRMFQYRVNFTSALNVSAVLQFPIIAYPTPDNVLWQKYVISNWTDLPYKNNITTSRIEHNISLTVHNISEEDFGRYRLIIANDVGNYTREFYINAEDRPKPPTGFRVIKRLTTATTATVQWFPSFDGGKPQHFVLNCSKTHHDSWFSEVINDTEDPIINYTINRLSSNTAYFITLLSENDIGSSELSERIEVHTKVIHVDAKKNITGIVIGSVCGVIGVTVVVTVGMCVFKKRRIEKAPDKMVYQNVPNIGSSKKINSATEYEGIDLVAVGANKQPNDSTSTDTSSEALPQNPYEKLDNILKDSNHYIELKRMDENRDDVSRKSIADSAPETLQKDFDKAIYMNMKI